MCGRCRCTLRPDDVSRSYNLGNRPLRHINMDRYQPSYNVAPGFNVPVIRRDDGKESKDGQSKGQSQSQSQSEEDGVVLHCMKWGLIPSFTKKTEKANHFLMFNARSETIKEKASFRRLIPNSRCLVSVEGFYEWKKDGSKKQPYYIHFNDGKPLVFAALYDSWKNPEGKKWITRGFNKLVSIDTSFDSWLRFSFHRRGSIYLHDFDHFVIFIVEMAPWMPVILPNKESSDMWLNGPPTSNFDTILRPYEEADLIWYPVTPAMGKPSFGGPDCIKEIQLKSEEKKPISHFFSKKGAKREKEESNEDRKYMKSGEEKELDNHGTESMCNLDESDIKPEVLSPKEDPVDGKLKQEDDEISAPKTDCSGSSPLRKKVKVTKDVGTSNITKGSPKGKHEFENFSDTAKLTTPVKMKGKVANDSQSQPTLFSYFKKN